MQWMRGAVAILGLAAAGCDQFTAPTDTGLGSPGDLASPPAPVADLEDFRGRSYSDFVAAHEGRFGPEALALSAPDGARLDRIMAGASGMPLRGGGVEALVFRGCAESGCADGLGVVAVDAENGAVFVGLRNGPNEDVLIPNDRLEALLRLNAPNRDWTGVAVDESPTQTPPGVPAQP